MSDRGSARTEWGVRTAPPWLDRAPGVGAVVVLVLVIISVVLAGNNRSLQEKVSAGQATLSNAQAAANVDNTLIRLLTAAAVEHDDAAIKSLLAGNGITYRQNGATQPAPAPTPGAP